MRLSIENASEKTRIELKSKLLRAEAAYKQHNSCKNLMVVRQSEDLLHGIHVITRNTKEIVDMLYDSIVVEMSEEFPELILVK